MSSRNKRREDDPTVTLSKSLSYTLRHGAEKEKINMRPDGYVSMDELLAHKKYKGVTFQQIQALVANNDKQRFKLLEEPAGSGKYFIRANQGHSLTTVQVEMQEIKSADEAPVCVHGTYLDAWQFIKTSGLNKMGRQHIHFATGLPKDDHVISGMRKSCQVLVYVDVAAALALGIKFYKSENGVILSDGLNGIIPPCCFKQVVNVQTKENIAFEKLTMEQLTNVPAPEQKKQKKPQQQQQGKK